MTFIAAAVVLPVVMAMLAGGCGLLVERASGRRLPGALVLPLGFALMLVIANLPLTLEATAWLGPWLMLAASVTGWILGARTLRDRRPSGWGTAACVLVYVVMCAPILIAARVTLSGYLLDGTVAIHLLAADHLVEHGRDFSMLPPSSASGALVAYFDLNSYPTGSQMLLGSAGKLVPVDLAWLYQPLIAFMVALAVLPCFAVLRRLGAVERVAALGASLAAVPALVVAYAYMGAVKEMAVLLFLVLIIPLTADYRDHRAAGVRAAVAPLAVASAAGVAAIGLAVAVWLGMMILLCATLALLAVRTGAMTRRLAGLQAAGLSVALAVLCFPTLTELASSVALAGTLSETNVALAADPGNLLQPLALRQLFGVWLSGTHRIDPTEYFAATMSLIGVVVACLVLGIAWLARRRDWLLLGNLAGFGAALWMLTVRGTDWLDAKVLVLTSPIAVLVAVIGILGLADSERRLEALVLGASLALGVFGSAALLYHDTNLAPTDRLSELSRIGDRFAGRGPAYVADFDEIALYFLRRSAPEGPGFAHRTRRTSTLRSGRPPSYGATYDTDQIPWRRLREFRLLVLRLGPNASVPPSAYQRVVRGAYYEVWERRRVRPLIEHHAFGAGGSPTAVPPCGEVRRLATRARKNGGDLLAALRPPALRFDPKLATSTPANWWPLPGRGIIVNGSGSLRYDVVVARSGRYRLWLEGDLIRRTSATVDGQEVEVVEGSSGGERNVAGGTKVIALSAGVHRLQISQAGGSLRPGDSPYGRLLEIVFEPAEDAVTQRRRRPAEWRTLCGRAVDWIEIRRF